MAVSTSVTLPAQPAAGDTTFQPLGGNGTTAPLGSYIVEAQIAGDASGGNATVTINGDPRYTNVFAWLDALIDTDAAAGEFMLTISRGGGSLEAPPRIMGTIPHVATGLAATNASFLWYPPVMLYNQAGSAAAQFPNVGVLETYILRLQSFVFNDNVQQLAAYQWLAMVQSSGGSVSLT